MCSLYDVRFRIESFRDHCVQGCDIPMNDGIVSLLLKDLLLRDSGESGVFFSLPTKIEQASETKEEEHRYRYSKARKPPFSSAISI